MKFTGLIKDAFRYAADNWFNVIILGIVIFLAENIDHLLGHSQGITVIELIFYIIIFILICMEAGYFYRIIKETVNGSFNQPKLNNIKSLFSHGLKEVIVFFIYFSIPILILALATFEFQYYLSAIFVNPQIFAHYVITDIIYYYLLPSVIPSQLDPEFIFEITVALFVAVIFYFLFLTALLNMGYHNGTLRSGLNIWRIFYLLREVGVKKLVVVYILLGTLTLLLGLDLFYDYFEMVPTFFDWNIIDLFIQIVVLPYFLIVTIRLLGLIGRTQTPYFKNSKPKKR